MLSKLCRRRCLTLVPRSQRQIHVRNFHSERQTSGLNLLVKPFVFTITVCGSSFLLATIAQYENNMQIWDKARNKIKNQFKSDSNSLLQQIKSYWNKQKDGLKVFAGIALLNSIVFLCWRIPFCRSIMNKYFLVQIDSKSIRCLPMILSTFSHYSPLHLAVNMFVLHSFCNIGVQLYGKENFTALYLSSGVVSSFVSCIHKVVSRTPSYSLGASGAILGILAAVCMERPDIQLMIMFLPFFSFSAGTAIKGIVLLDTLGLLLKWNFFDHAAHLGGTLFGIYYVQQLKRVINGQKVTVIKQWNEFKKNF